LCSKSKNQQQSDHRTHSPNTKSMADGANVEIMTGLDTRAFLDHNARVRNGR
jgi:hypothetical protein